MAKQYPRVRSAPIQQNSHVDQSPVAWKTGDRVVLRALKNWGRVCILIDLTKEGVFDQI
jgi:hypothetical protein